MAETDTEGVWIAYYNDWSGLAVFDDEVSALRHAVNNRMEVGFAKFGTDLGGGRHPDEGRRPPRDSMDSERMADRRG